ncbi:MAG: diaminopimelate decarboxylase [Ruminococcaceae bacterium]|nr:diaminopimelate decarboxylase [Oscillospiraceae bacterium]
MFICDNLGANADGHLTFAGQDTAALAARYGTPLYLMDEARVRHNCRVYRDAMRAHFAAGSRPLYAGKANCFAQLYRIMAEEDMGVDVVSCGEIRTAEKAGYDLANAYFHGNCKTDADIACAMARGVGYFVADNADELAAIEAEAARRGVRQKVLLRLTPGIDTHTYEAVNTGRVDSKFGAAIETGQAAELTALALRQAHIELTGFHCHVGSQVFAEDVFERAAVVMLEFIAAMRDAHGYTAQQLDLGGGYGVRYVADDPVLDIGEKIASVAAAVHAACARLNIPEPAILLEPGRSIVADAGLTLYTVGAVKRIPGYKNYVAVDGGMGDNPRFALYKSRYTVLPAGRMDAPRPLDCSVVGRCCESGDIIQENVPMPEDIRRGDLVAVCTTGAYNYSMASNYNRVPRPPIVMLRGDESFVAVRRETFDDLCALDA